MKIQQDQIILAYDLAKQRHQKEIEDDDALQSAMDGGMNENSARMYFRNFDTLLIGESSLVEMNAKSFDIYFEKLYVDFGLEKLEIALLAFEKYIDDKEKKQGSKRKSYRQVLEKHSNFYKQNLENIFDSDDQNSFPEGKESYKLHKRKERNSRLIKEAKERYIKKDPNLSCQVCGFSFKENYGKIGNGFIEAHHIYPISKLSKETKSRIEDIALVCSNCHRMLHRQRPWLKSVKKMRKLMKKAKSWI